MKAQSFPLTDKNISGISMGDFKFFPVVGTSFGFSIAGGHQIPYLIDFYSF